MVVIKVRHLKVNGELFEDIKWDHRFINEIK